MLDYGINVKKGKLEFIENSCTVPKRLVFAYLLALVQAAGASRVLLAGFDGYSQDYSSSLGHSQMVDITSLIL